MTTTSKSYTQNQVAPMSAVEYRENFRMVCSFPKTLREKPHLGCNGSLMTQGKGRFGARIDQDFIPLLDNTITQTIGYCSANRPDFPQSAQQRNAYAFYRGLLALSQTYRHKELNFAAKAGDFASVTAIDINQFEKFNSLRAQKDFYPQYFNSIYGSGFTEGFANLDPEGWSEDPEIRSFLNSIKGKFGHQIPLNREETTLLHCWMHDSTLHRLENFWGSLKSGEDLEDRFGLNEATDDLDQLPNDLLAKIHEAMFPLKNPEEIFLGEAPFPWPSMEHSGQGLGGMKNRVFVRALVRQAIADGNELAANTAIIKKLASLEPAKDFLFETPKGLYRVERHFEKDGAYATYLYPLNTASKDAPEKLLIFRSTRTHASATSNLASVANDIHEDVGKPGADAIHRLLGEELFSQLADGETITAMGYSLGANQLARTLIHFGKHVSTAFLFCGPGFSNKEDSFDFIRSLSKRTTPLTLMVVEDDRDAVSRYGFLLGACHGDSDFEAILLEKTNLLYLNMSLLPEGLDANRPLIVDFSSTAERPHIPRVTSQRKRDSLAFFKKGLGDWHKQLFTSNPNAYLYRMEVNEGNMAAFQEIVHNQNSGIDTVARKVSTWTPTKKFSKYLLKKGSSKT